MKTTEHSNPTPLKPYIVEAVAKQQRCFAWLVIVSKERYDDMYINMLEFVSRTAEDLSILLLNYMRENPDNTYGIRIGDNMIQGKNFI